MRANNQRDKQPTPLTHGGAGLFGVIDDQAITLSLSVTTKSYIKTNGFLCEKSVETLRQIGFLAEPTKSTRNSPAYGPRNVLLNPTLQMTTFREFVITMLPARENVQFISGSGPQKQRHAPSV